MYAPAYTVLLQTLPPPPTLGVTKGGLEKYQESAAAIVINAVVAYTHAAFPRKRKYEKGQEIANPKQPRPVAIFLLRFRVKKPLETGGGSQNKMGQKGGEGH